MSGKRKAKAPLCLVKDHQGWRTYSISYWHMSYWGMQLFTGHDIIISCSIRGAWKNETLGSLTSPAQGKIKWNSRWYSSHISSQATKQCNALRLYTRNGWAWSANLSFCCTRRMGGICSVRYSLSILMVGTASTDAVTPVEHQATLKIYQKKGAAISTSSKSLHTIGRLKLSKGKCSAALCLCRSRVNKSRICSLNCISQFLKDKAQPLDVTFLKKRRGWCIKDLTIEMIFSECWNVCFLFPMTFLSYPYTPQLWMCELIIEEKLSS